MKTVNNCDTDVIGAKGILATGEALWLGFIKYNIFENILICDHGHLGGRYGEYMSGLVWYGTACYVKKLFK